MEPTTTDWRLFGQEKYLFGVDLIRREYDRDAVVNSPWEDDHCEFCKTEFMKHTVPDVLHEGYTTSNGLHWICDDCFNDFQPMFRWKVVESSNQRSPDRPLE